MTDLDPVTFQIINHRLYRVTDEAIASLKRVSGSPVVTEGHDFIMAIYDNEGDLITSGMGVLKHMVPASRAVKHIIERYEGDIDRGDMFLLNDPYAAAMHAPDMYVINPIFFEDALQAYSCSFVHISDNGAIDMGGFSSRATEVFHDGFQTPGLRFMEAGDIQQDILDTIMNMSRTPEMVEMDIRSQVAAHNVASERLRNVMSEYGETPVNEVAHQLIGQSENSLRERLAEIPDGQWQSRQYIDSYSEDKLYTIKLTLRKEDNELVFDFSGTSDQSEIGLNCTFWPAVGAAFVPILPILCPDLTWNDGILKPIDVRAPDGSLVNATRPASPNTATATTLNALSEVATIAISKMVGTHPKYADRATPVWHGSHGGVFLGVKRHGSMNIEILTDTLAGAAGARSFRDGDDLGGELLNTVGRWANVERHEESFPLVYLYRTFLQDSGGPGKYRGGVGHEFAVTSHPSIKAEDVDLNTFGIGGMVPRGKGLFGGYPGCTLNYTIHRDTSIVEENGLEARGPSDLDSETTENAQWGNHVLAHNDAFSLNFAGSGGYGDPVKRDPQAVVQDVREGKIAPKTAKRVYGVPAATTGNVDMEAVQRERAEIRDQRLEISNQFESPIASADTEDTDFNLGEHVKLVRGNSDENEYVACRECDTVLAPMEKNWKESMLTIESDPSKAGLCRDAHEQIEFREIVCFSCGTLIDADVAHEDDPHLYEFVTVA